MHSKKHNLIYIAARYTNLISSPIKYLQDKFENIFILTFHRAFRRYPPIYGYCELELPDNVNVIPMGKFIPPAVLSSSFGSIGFHVYKQLLKLYAYKSAKYLKENRIMVDLIHAHSVLPAGLIAYFLKEILHSKLIITAHGYDIYNLPFRNEYLKQISQNILKKCDKTVTVSFKNASILKKLGINNFTVIPNGFDPDVFFMMDQLNCRNTMGLPRSCNIILTVGGLDPIKNHKLLLDAFKKVMYKRDDVYLVIVGDGKLKDTLIKHSTFLGIKNKVLFTGWIPNNKIVYWMNACDVFVLPSLCEGNPIVMFETLGCGKPFIGTNVGGIPEIITNEKLGIIVKPEDVNGLANAILEALDKEWDKGYILNYAKQYTWDRIARRNMGVYNEVFEKK